MSTAGPISAVESIGRMPSRNSFFSASGVSVARALRLTSSVLDAQKRPRTPSSSARKKCPRYTRSEEHTSELQSRGHLVCRLLLEKKNPLVGQSRYILRQVERIVISSSL